MDYLIKTETYQLATTEREFLDKLTLFQKNLQRILDTLVVPADETYRYAIALNKLTERELHQNEPCLMIPALLDQFVDKSLFEDNGFTLSQDATVISPVALICIDDASNVDNLIEAILEPFYATGYSVEEGDVIAYVYINIRDILEYQIVEEYVKAWYTYVDVVSCTLAPQGFDFNKHVSVKLADVIGDPVNLLNNSQEIFTSYLQGNEDKSLYFTESDQGRSQISIFDVVALANLHGVNVDMHQSYAQVYGDYLAKMWFSFSPAEKTIVEFLEDIFNAPSCVKVSGLTDMLGIVEGIIVKIKAVNIMDGQEVIIELTDSYSVSEVIDDYNALLKRDARNTLPTLFNYQGSSYRWMFHQVDLSLRGQVYGLKQNVALKVSYSDKISFLHPFLGAKAYYGFLKGKNYRPANVPNRFQTYLARKIRLTGEQIENLTLPTELVAFWKKENRDLTKVLRLLQEIVTIETLENLGQFNGQFGFNRERVVLRLDQLGADLDGVSI